MNKPTTLALFALFFISLTPCRAANDPAPSGALEPLIRYEFETLEEGRVPDLSGRGFDGTARGDGARLGAGKSGRCLVLNADVDDGYVELPSDAIAALTDFTVCFWTNLPEYTPYGRLFDFGQDERVNAYLTASTTSDAINGKMQFAATTNSTDGEQLISIPTQFPLNRWIHVAALQRGDVLELYLNGRLAAFQYGVDHNLRSLLGSKGRCYIGKSQYSHDANLRGSIDDFRLYGRALTQGEILGVMAEVVGEVSDLATYETTTLLGESARLPNLVCGRDDAGEPFESGVVWDYPKVPLGRDYDVTGIIGSTRRVVGRVRVESDSLGSAVAVRSDLIRLRPGVSSPTGRFWAANNGDSPVEFDLVMELLDASGAVLSVEIERVALDGGDQIERRLIPILPLEKGVARARTYARTVDGTQTSVVREYALRGLKSGSFLEDSCVNLLPGIFKQMRDDNARNLMQLDLDRLCASHFLAAGLPAKGERYGGWERWESSGFGIGHWLSAACLMYEKTGDEAWLEKINYAVSELSQTQRADGFIGGVDEALVVANIFDRRADFEATPYSVGRIWDCWYGIQKVFKGLVEAYETTGNREALETATRFVHWLKRATDRFSYGETQRMLRAEHGAVSETALRLYKLVGDAEALELAIRFLRSDLLDPLASGEDNLTGRHVNEQIPEIQNAAAFYEISGDEKYKRAAEFFWTTCRARRMYANSGLGLAEHFPRADKEPLGPSNTETCCTFNMLKLTELLFSWERRVEYMDYVEDALFNLIYPSQDQDNREGYGKCYFVSFLPGSYRFFSTRDDSFWCCCLGGMENPVRMDKMIYYKDGDELYVNLFVPSEARWKETGLILKQETSFPYSDVSVITILGGEATCALKVRAPSWLAGELGLKVNGERVAAEIQGGYATIRRAWRAGDVLEITTPMALNLYRSRNSDAEVAFRYGPILLAAVLDEVPDAERYTTHNNKLWNFKGLPMPTLSGSPREASSFLVPVDLSRLVFQTAPNATSDGSTLTFRPFFELNRNRYTVYWTINASLENEKDSERSDF